MSWALRSRLRKIFSPSRLHLGFYFSPCRQWKYTCSLCIECQPRLDRWEANCSLHWGGSYPYSLILDHRFVSAHSVLIDCSSGYFTFTCHILTPPPTNMIWNSDYPLLSTLSFHVKLPTIPHWCHRSLFTTNYKRFTQFLMWCGTPSRSGVLRHAVIVIVGHHVDLCRVKFSFSV